MFSQPMCPFQMNNLGSALFLHDEETDTDCAVGGVGSAGLSLLWISNLFLAPIFFFFFFWSMTPLIYLYKNYYCPCIAVIILGNVNGVNTRAAFGLCFYSLFHVHVSPCGSMGLQ